MVYEGGGADGVNVRPRLRVVSELEQVLGTSVGVTPGCGKIVTFETEVMV
jgi:hypothetical protein